MREIAYFARSFFSFNRDAMKTLRPFVGLLVLWLGVSADADAQVNFSSSNLPILVIEVDQQIVDEPKVPARMGLIDNGEGVG